MPHENRTQSGHIDKTRKGDLINQARNWRSHLGHNELDKIIYKLYLLISRGVNMKAKIPILGLICFFIFIYCEGDIENPYSPILPDSTPLPLPSYIYFEFEVTMSITLADDTPFLNENDYCTFYQTVADKQVSPIDISYREPSGDFTKTIEISLISTFQEEDMNVDCRLFTTGSSIEEEWLKSAQFIFKLKLVPITEGFIFEPAEQQVILTGWMVDETGWDNHQFIYFTLIKE